MGAFTPSSPSEVGTRLALLRRDRTQVFCFMNQKPKDNFESSHESIQLPPRRVQILKISLQTQNTGTNQPQQSHPTTPFRVNTHQSPLPPPRPWPTAQGSSPKITSKHKENSSPNFCFILTASFNLLPQKDPGHVLKSIPGLPLPSQTLQKQINKNQ